MSDEQHPCEADDRQINSQLHQSLRTCRAMVANYRLMLAGGANDNPPQETASDCLAEQAVQADEA